VNDDPVLNIDFASTISELADIVPQDPQDGDSLVPLLHGEKIPWRRDYLIEYLGKNKIRGSGPPPYVAIHTRRYLYVEYHFRHWRELYDLRRDPWELDNVVDDPAYARIRAVLERQLNALYEAPPHSPRTLEAQPHL
jgi:arylsulfatase A-like enzyme